MNIISLILILGYCWMLNVFSHHYLIFFRRVFQGQDTETRNSHGFGRPRIFNVYTCCLKYTGCSKSDKKNNIFFIVQKYWHRFFIFWCGYLTLCRQQAWHYLLLPFGWQWMDTNSTPYLRCQVKMISLRLPGLPSLQASPSSSHACLASMLPWKEAVISCWWWVSIQEHNDKDLPNM